uniref:ascorbate ferrireductase (transmembrane) n=1 Tax=Schistosoma japonicum TaxID=6182 RepID=C1L3R5_SCHJA|nr:cytochrome b-561 domain containing 2 [Schistosoma japonicum]
MSIIRGFVFLSTTILCLMIIYFSSRYNGIFSLHPFFMSFGFLFLMLNGINALVSQGETFFGLLKSRSQKIKAHWIFESLSVLFLFFGFLAIFANKTLNGKPHFTTWHEISGVVVVFYSICQFFVGSLLHWRYSLWRSILTYSSGRYIHALSGVVLYCILSFTFILGLCTNWFKSYIFMYFNSLNTLVLFLCIVVAILNTFIVSLQVITKYNKFFRIKLFDSHEGAQG